MQMIMDRHSDGNPRSDESPISSVEILSMSENFFRGMEYLSLAVTQLEHAYSNSSSSSINSVKKSLLELADRFIHVAAAVDTSDLELGTGDSTHDGLIHQRVTVPPGFEARFEHLAREPPINWQNSGDLGVANGYDRYSSGGDLSRINNTTTQLAVEHNASADLALETRVSWAKIAAQGVENRRVMIPHQTSTKFIVATSETSMSEDPDTNPSGQRMPPLTSTNCTRNRGGAERAAHQRRTVIIHNLSITETTLSTLSSTITVGPIFSLKLVPTLAVSFTPKDCKPPTTLRAEISFASHEHATIYYERLTGAESKNLIAKFTIPSGYMLGVDYGPKTPMGSLIARMISPVLPHPSRRLTIVRSKIFTPNAEQAAETGQLAIRKFVSDMVGLCGGAAKRAEKIEKIFLYNAGNATVVFADVETAVTVRNTLMQWSTRGGSGGGRKEYKGVQVSFSKDFCEDGPLSGISHFRLVSVWDEGLLKSLGVY